MLCSPFLTDKNCLPLQIHYKKTDYIWIKVKFVIDYIWIKVKFVEDSL